MLVLASAVSAGLAAPAWADTVTPVSGTTLLAGMACSTSTTCIAAGQAGAQTNGVVVPVTNDTPGGVQQVSGTNELYAAACSSSTSCWAVGVGNNASDGMIVPVTNGTAGGAQDISGTAFLRGVTCASSSSCVAVGWMTGNYNNGAGRIGVVVPITNGTPGGAQQVPGTLDVLGVACSTATSCVGVGSAAPGSSGAIVPITNGTAGGAQTVSALLDGVACPTSSDCLAVGDIAGSGNATGAVVPITNGSPGAVEQAQGINNLAGVACPSATTCEAVGWYATTNTAGVVTITNGTPGAVTSESGAEQLYGVACPSGTGCLAEGETSGNGTGVVASITPGQSGPPPPPPPPPKKPATPNKAKARLTALQDGVNVFGLEAAFCTVGASSAGAGLALAPVGGAQYSGLLFVAGARLCLAAVGRLAGDYKTFIDPPLTDYHDVATVPAAPVGRAATRTCARATGRARVLCERLASAIATLVSDEQNVSSIASAIAKTVARDAAARDAGDQAGVTLQEQALAGLETQFTSARQKAAAAGGRLVKLLRPLGGSGRLPKKLYAKGLALLYKKLSAADVTKTDVASMLGRAPSTTPPNLFTALAHG